MQFVKNGPDIPERLLQSHEDGGVVFFCGAGISFPAQLPGFAGLVKKLYSTLAISPNPVQQAAIKAEQFDTAIGLLEADIVGGRGVVRKELAQILNPVLTARNATRTHKALLTLGKSREGYTRIVTTNFDRIFEEVIASQNLEIEQFQAPLLPVPKKSSWNGLVYLHGLLPSVLASNELDRLVISSGDFGRAYLTERWAARFISELFRNYIVCFVGYSINDPVLRYMLDALAADRRIGEPFPEAFAFGNFPKGNEDKTADEWKAKGVTPILYRNHCRHAYLHRTIWEWARTYHDGVRGKEAVVVECAMARPLASTRQDDLVGRLLWALSDSNGLPAKRFAELDPVPSLEWLEPLSEERFQHSDLGRFGVPPKESVNDKLAFSLTRRPSPYSLAPWMCIADSGAHGSRWDEVMRHLARWLIRHLDDPKLLLWLVKRGGQLHKDLIFLIERRLGELTDYERKGNTEKLDRIRANAPRAIPGPPMRTLWRLLLTGRVKSWAREFDLYRWRNQFYRDGLTSSLRLGLREILTPRISLREPFRLPVEVGNGREPVRIRDLVEWKIVLSTDHIHSTLSDLSKDKRWTAALPDLLADFSALLRDALDLKRELGGAGDKSDLSYLHQPSISEHPQNRDFHDWTALIKLTRDAWLATAESDPERASIEAETWWRTPYPLFRRLSFFAATQNGVINNRRALDWLLGDDKWWLWSNETEREAMRLMVELAPRLNEPMLLELEQAILIGPPREISKEDTDSERGAGFVELNVWLRLAKIAEAGASLGAAGQETLDALSAKHPEWRLTDDQREEFSFWMGGGDELRTFVATPRRRRDLVEYLKTHPNADYWQQDDWRERCRDNFSTTACALCELANEDLWPNDRWREALQAWSEEGLVNRSWRYMAKVVVEVPNEVLQELAHSVSWWLRSIAQSFEGQEELYFALARRLLALGYQEDGDADDPVMRAINHPVGHTTEALLRWWYRRSLEDKQGLPESLKALFNELCDIRVEKFRHARVLLATHVVVLFRVDSEWAAQRLLPLFNWHQTEVEARAAWQGFLGNPRLYRPLMELLKPSFLETARRYDVLGEYGRQYASLLTFVALDRVDVFTVTELADATNSLPPDGLNETAQTLVRALEGVEEQRAEHWHNRVVPYLHNIWPKSRDKISPAIAESLGRLCVAAGESFPEALVMLRGWLQPPDHPDYLVHQLHNAEICEKFPEVALDFLSLVIGDQTQWPPGDLSGCLRAIRTAAPELQEDPRFERLMVYLRRRGEDLE